VRGFEPPASTSRTTPNQSVVYGRVSGCTDLAGHSTFAVPARVGSYQEMSGRLAPTMAPTTASLRIGRSSGLTSAGSMSRRQRGRYELCPRLVGPPARGDGRFVDPLLAPICGTACSMALTSTSSTRPSTKSTTHHRRRIATRIHALRPSAWLTPFRPGRPAQTMLSQ